LKKYKQRLFNQEDPITNCQLVGSKIEYLSFAIQSKAQMGKIQINKEKIRNNSQDLNYDFERKANAYETFKAKLDSFTHE